MKRILVTGAGGYLGGRIIDYIAKQNDIIVIAASSKPILQYVSYANVVSVQIDLRDELKVNELCKGVEAIIHTAGVNAQDSFANPLNAFDFNLKSTLALSKAATLNSISKFVFISTAHVYDSPLHGNINEDTYVKSTHPYATSHRSAEDIVLSLSLNSKIEGIVLRLSNSFGAPLTKEANCWSLLMNDLCFQAVTTFKMVINSNYNQKRDFVPITFFIKALEFILNENKLDINNKIINIGGDWSPSLLEVAKRIAERVKIKLNKHIPIEANKFSDEITELNYSVEKLKSLGFSENPSNYIDCELDELINFCVKNFSK